jgi:MFS family permease
MAAESSRTLWKVIAASSAGTLIEWYDFYIFGSLAVTISEVFFPKGAGAAALLSTLATFAIGFVVRPFGAMFFGFLGDRIGRKYTFMVTLLLMGGATFLIGVLPGFATIGWAAPIALIVLRLLQGLALGGEYGGAATYVAEHAPDGRRGFWTSWIQTTATLGLFVSLAVILACRTLLSKEDFNAWGWRIPFWISLLLVVFSYYIRRRMNESPLFARAKAAGKTSRNPFKDSFGNRKNLRIVLIALFGATAGQGVIWYTGQFYAMYFIKTIVGIDATQAEYIIGIALLLGTPFFIVFGALSDRNGRKPIMLAGCLLGVVSYYPIYSTMLGAADVTNASRFRLVSSQPLAEPEIKVIPADPLANPRPRTITTTRDRNTYHDGTISIVTAVRTETGAPADSVIETSIQVKRAIRFSQLTGPAALTLIGLVWVQVLFVTMVYGPIAAFLVELFPTRIRYSSMSLPYHIGNGVFGGMVPFIGTLIVARTGDPLSGIWYPMAIAAMTVIVGLIFLRERRNVSMWDESMDA